MPWSLLLSAAKIAGPALAIGGFLLWLNVSSYNRGFRERDQQAAAAIAKNNKAVIADRARYRAMKPGALDDEFKRLCREQGGTEDRCK